MKINGFGPHRSSALSLGAGRAACLAPWHALVRAVRKQLLTLPGRTLFKSLSYSKDLCCLILFFSEHVRCRPLVLLPPAASLFSAGLCNIAMLGKGAVQIAQRMSHCVGVWARPGRSHGISDWRASSLGGRSGRWGGGTLMPCANHWNDSSANTQEEKACTERKERHARS